jgi:ABC-type microcin C transport system permease subunit YejE
MKKIKRNSWNIWQQSCFLILLVFSRICELIKFIKARPWLIKERAFEWYFDKATKTSIQLLKCVPWYELKLPTFQEAMKKEQERRKTGI